MADLVAVLEEILEQQREEPSDALVRLTQATSRLSSKWAEYQEALDPEGWLLTKYRLVAHDVSDNDQDLPKASSL
ncbi:MAG TPA: hypothetical protein VJB57_06365 [Dehalococcoidia bacterium]|nr:hypothetical protein [Dehalococcoidia bacterium]